jgi:ATP-dependent Clp protease ATP-binding subunit ClpC
MGARPLRRAIQRYIEDPLADEVLKAGPGNIISGTTVMVERDETGDEEDRPLKLTLIAPKKRRARKSEDVEPEPEPVTVGGDGEETPPQPNEGE